MLDGALVFILFLFLIPVYVSCIFQTGPLARWIRFRSSESKTGRHNSKLHCLVAGSVGIAHLISAIFLFLSIYMEIHWLQVLSGLLLCSPLMYIVYTKTGTRFQKNK